MDWKSKADKYKTKEELKLAISRMIRNRDKTNPEHTEMFNYLFRRYASFLELSTEEDLAFEKEKLEVEEKDRFVKEAVRVFTSPLVI